MRQKSFTLIELLIVGTIIIILAGFAIIAMSLMSSDKPEGATMISDFLQIQNIASRIYLDTGNYDSVCCDAGCDEEIKGLCDDLSNIFDDTGPPPPYVERSDSGPPFFGYCMWSYAHTESGLFCIDHKGYAGDNLDNLYCSKSRIVPACNNN